MAKLLNTIELDVDAIRCNERLRPVSELAVTSLIGSIQEIGLQSEIHVRKVHHQGGIIKLIAGGHRLEAFRRMGLQKIPCKVWDCTDDWALMSEIDDNLGHNDLSPLDLAIFLARRKEVYERLYPETKQGGLKGNQHSGIRKTDIMSFSQSCAEQRDMTPRQIRRIVAAGQHLDDATIVQLRKAPRKVSMADLQELAKCGEPADRKLICEALSKGTAKSAADALKQAKQKTCPGDVAISPADKAARTLADAFARAPKEGRVRFVRDHADVLRELLDALPAEPTEVVQFTARKRGNS